MANNSSMSVYLFFENNDFPRKYSYSFHKIDVQLENSKESRNEAVVMKAPIFEFPAGEYPSRMGCAQLGGGGSMFYFCGGSFSSYSPSLLKQPHQMELLNHLFPPYIYTLDTAAADAKLLKLGQKMETGKPIPLVFSANGKIYVMSAIGDVQRKLANWFDSHKGYKFEEQVSLFRSVKLFECYDPVDNKWKLLPESPLRKLSFLSGYLLLEDQQKMVLTARGFHGYSHLLYDLDQDAWLYQLNQDTCISSSMLHRVNNWVSHHVGGFCYGVSPFMCSTPLKLGPFLLQKPQQEDHQPNVSLSTMSLVHPRDTLHVGTTFGCTSMLQHLGDASFLFVSSAQGYINNNLETEDPYTHEVFITIFKDVDADAKLSSFKSEIIFSKDYVSTTDYDCLRTLRACFHTPAPLPTIKGPIMNSV